MTIKVSVAPKGMGLNDFVAMQEGLFADEGLDVEFDMNIFRGTQSSWKGLTYFERPQDTPFSEGRSVIQGACAWGSICNASAGMGKFVPDCYGISPWGIFVRPDSKITRPEDLKDVPIAVGMRAGTTSTFPSGWKNTSRSRTSSRSTSAASARVSQLCSMARSR